MACQLDIDGTSPGAYLLPSTSHFKVQSATTSCTPWKDLLQAFRARSPSPSPLRGYPTVAMALLPCNRPSLNAGLLTMVLLVMPLPLFAELRVADPHEMPFAHPTRIYLAFADGWYRTANTGRR